MRRIKIDCILAKSYSISNNKVIKEENGRYFSEEIAKMILVNQKHNDLENIKKLEKQDERKHEKAVKKYCETRTNEIDLEKYPSLIEKEYEIFQLDLHTENIYLFHKKDLPLAEILENQELFFKLENAQKSLKLYRGTKGNIITNYSEFSNQFDSDIKVQFDQLETLKQEDEKEYIECVKAYNKIKNTDFMKNYHNLVNENKMLNKAVEKSQQLLLKTKERNKVLEQKLKIALEEIEEDRKNTFLKIFFKGKKNKKDF